MIFKYYPPNKTRKCEFGTLLSNWFGTCLVLSEGGGTSHVAVMNSRRSRGCKRETKQAARQPPTHIQPGETKPVALADQQVKD